MNLQMTINYFEFVYYMIQLKLSYTISKYITQLTHVSCDQNKKYIYTDSKNKMDRPSILSLIDHEVAKEEIAESILRDQLYLRDINFY